MASTTPTRVTSLLHVALAITLFLAVWGAKLALMGKYGSDLPFWDQWEREGDHLFIPWFEHHELWQPLTAAHNEHRIVPTLAANFGLTLATGQWDARVQCAFSAGLHALIVMGLFVWARRHLPLTWAIAAGVLLGATGSLPIDWENLLGGFQSQFYFLIGFALLALHGLLCHRPLSAAWWGGVVAAGLGGISMGSGLLVGPVVIVVVLLRRRWQGRKEQGDRTTLLVAIALGAMGAWLYNPIAGHAVYRAQSAREFFVYFLQCLAWPVPELPWLAPVIWAPWVWLAFRQARNMPASPDEARRAEFIVAVGLWVLVQAAAAAYSRSGSGELPASRYGDVFEMGVAMGFLALPLLSKSGRRVWFGGVVAVWLGVVSTAHVTAGRKAWTSALENKKADYVAYEKNVGRFVLTDDYATFEKQDIPFPYPEWLARILRTPCIRTILPVSVRPPLSIPRLASLESYGASAPIEPLPDRATRALVGPAEWRSAEVAPTDGWWKIETAGELGAPGATLEIVAVRDGRVLGSVAPSKRAERTWRAAYVRAPSEPAYLRARCSSMASWFAFSEPTAMSAASWWVWRACKQGLVVAVLGWGLFGVCGVVAWYRGRLARVGAEEVADYAAREGVRGTA